HVHRADGRRARRESRDRRAREDGGGLRARRDGCLRAHVKLVTYDDGKVGYVDGEEIVRLDAPTMREWFERGGADETGERTSLADANLRTPIVPKKFFHPAGNFREHDEEEKNVNCTHPAASSSNSFQKV